MLTLVERVNFQLATVAGEGNLIRLEPLLKTDKTISFLRRLATTRYG
jgi:hypothetical protein